MAHSAPVQPPPPRAPVQPPAPPPPVPAAVTARMSELVPQPVSADAIAGTGYTVTAATAIHASGDAAGIADDLTGPLRKATGYPLPVDSGSGAGISLLITPDAKLGAEGYRLDVSGISVIITGGSAAGLYHGLQTLWQLLPPDAVGGIKASGPWQVPAGHITDYPRYGYRGAMLDVARHFFTVQQVERYIDDISLYKVNYLHLHLSDDQGWRMAINGYPSLTSVGAQTEVGGGPGGFYSQADYTAIVNYAQRHFITVVPEIDMPSHVGAALTADASLTCNGVSPPMFTGISPGFDNLCVGNNATYDFVDTVVGQLASLTPGPYFDIGGDEAKSLSVAQYAAFVSRAERIVAAHGKRVEAWSEVDASPVPSGALSEYWDTQTPDPRLGSSTSGGAKLIMAPANHTYLDQKYTPSTTLGLHWAGYHEVRDAYDWDPTTVAPGVSPSSVAGVEAALWTETTSTMSDVEYMAFPRLPAVAEIGWSPASTHSWSGFSARLGSQAPIWRALGMNYYHSPQVTWARYR